MGQYCYPQKTDDRIPREWFVEVRCASMVLQYMDNMDPCKCRDSPLVQCRSMSPRRSQTASYLEKWVPIAQVSWSVIAHGSCAPPSFPLSQSNTQNHEMVQHQRIGIEGETWRIEMIQAIEG